MMAFEHIGLSHHVRRKLADVPLVANRDTNESRDILAHLLSIKNGMVTHAPQAFLPSPLQPATRDPPPWLSQRGGIGRDFAE
jgi:hypothetical protein